MTAFAASRQDVENISHPLTQDMHGEPNEVIYLNCLYMGSKNDGKTYLLLLRDDDLSYLWLWSTYEATSEDEAEALLVWIGVSAAWIGWLPIREAT